MPSVISSTISATLCHARRHAFVAIAVFGLSGGLLGCHDLAGTQPLPAGTQDPSYYNNATGALGLRNSAMLNVFQSFPDYLITTGLLTDELADVTTLTGTAGQTGVIDPVDERILPELSYGTSQIYRTDQTYDNLQTNRATLLEAIGQLAVYDSSAKDTTILKPAVDRVLRGELYALYGYTEIMLADLFCSGIPLSTLDFQHDFTYRTGSSTEQVYIDALAKFDTAMTLAGDSVRILNLARIGKGRAYLDMDSAAAAAAVVAGVTDISYQYEFSTQWINGTIDGCSSGFTNYLQESSVLGNSEGGNGLPFASGTDPRTATLTDSVGYSSAAQNYNCAIFPVGYPRVYAAGITGGYFPITLASGIEAWLIEAEAALQPGGAGVNRWLTLLNTLRQTAKIPGTSAPAPDSLPNLTDPGIGSSNPDSARIALMFRERAMWLYLTGHRQGDLRRQLRQYHQYWPDQSRVYPTGPYPGVGTGFYGSDVTAPIPPAEYINPLFHGCIDRHA